MALELIYSRGTADGYTVKEYKEGSLSSATADTFPKVPPFTGRMICMHKNKLFRGPSRKGGCYGGFSTFLKNWYSPLKAHYLKYDYGPKRNKYGMLFRISYGQKEHDVKHKKAIVKWFVSLITSQPTIYDECVQAGQEELGLSLDEYREFTATYGLYIPSSLLLNAPKVRWMFLAMFFRNLWEFDLSKYSVPASITELRASIAASRGRLFGQYSDGWDPKILRLERKEFGLGQHYTVPPFISNVRFHEFFFGREFDTKGCTGDNYEPISGGNGVWSNSGHSLWEYINGEPINRDLVENRASGRWSDKALGFDSSSCENISPSRFLKIQKKFGQLVYNYEKEQPSCAA